MGLDMYAYTAPIELVGDAQVDMGECLFKDGNALKGVDTDFAYWRKFNNLHGWMENLYRVKGGSDEYFNCACLRLMPEDLNNLEIAVKNKDLPPTAGFFFGSMRELNDDDVAEVLNFIARAREAISQNKAVIYSSWW